ncbi:16S rRNA (cytosine(1402)-N(4))-methyltransferase [Rickettsiales bacterium (ex Bugula neritina AB1)]|nr:16S rRNA (cytosine(1402)-N(4))-methyltransferase [Rickettsiales bacterium (ex Bugula neritina AB1)]
MSHICVLKSEITEIIKEISPKFSLDFTFGAGGHTKIILNNSSSIVYGFDRDITTKKFANHLQQEYQNRFFYINDISSNVNEYNYIKNIDFILSDLGLSQMQLKSNRGFSYLRNEELDMQMGIKSLGKISHIINNINEYKLQEILRLYSEDKHWKKITKSIIEERQKYYISTTFQLKDIINKVVGNKNLYKSLSRCFQALRIYTNNEIFILQETLEKSFNILNKGGCMAFIGFHSIENKIIKNFFKIYLKNIKTFSPTSEEIDSNSQSRSAFMRIGVK